MIAIHTLAILKELPKQFFDEAERMEHREAAINPKSEHSVPWFWPYAAAIELGDEGLRLFRDNLKFVSRGWRDQRSVAPRMGNGQSRRP